MSDLRKLFDTIAQIEESDFTPYTDHQDIGQYDGDAEITADQLNMSTIKIEGVDSSDYPDFVDAFITHAEWADGSGQLTDEELERIDPAVVQDEAVQHLIGQADYLRDDAVEDDDDWMMKGGEDGLGPDGDGRHDRYQDADYGDDPWGLGEGDEDLMEYNDVREITNKIHEAMDEGMMDARAVADAALSYLSEDQVSDMARANDWMFFFDDEDYDEDLNELSTDHYDRYSKAADTAKTYHDKAKDMATNRGDDEHAAARFDKHKRKSSNRAKGMKRAQLGRARNTANARMKSQFGK